MKSAVAWAAGIVVAVIFSAIFVGFAYSADHQHPPQDAQIHDQFYSSWMRPDQPRVSCCNKQDCYPTEARVVGGQWLARRREDGKWLSVPASKIERHRDVPLGAHLCAPPPGSEAHYENGVICFGSGAGI